MALCDSVHGAQLPLRGDGRGQLDGEDFIKPPNAADRFFCAPSVFDDLEGDVNVAEVADEVAGGVYVAAAELTAPDYVVAGVEREGDVKSVALGLDFDHCGTFPLLDAASVVLDNHKAAPTSRKLSQC